MLAEYTVSDRIAYITLNRPEKRNALNQELVNTLREAFAKAESDQAVKVIVLKANGESFCAGADLGYLQQLQKFSYDENLADSKNLRDLFLQIYTSGKVVVAEVQGSAIAGGCGLATVCDFVFSVPEAKFGYTEVKIGFIPAIVMVFLLRKIGEGRAKELLLTGKLISAEDAKSMGLVNDIFDKSSLTREVNDFASRLIASASGQSLQRTKRMIATVQHMSLEDALEYAAHQNAEARATDDCIQGIHAFLEKKDLKW